MSMINISVLKVTVQLLKYAIYLLAMTLYRKQENTCYPTVLFVNLLINSVFFIWQIILLFSPLFHCTIKCIKYGNNWNHHPHTHIQDTDPSTLHILEQSPIACNFNLQLLILILSMLYSTFTWVNHKTYQQ